MDWRSMVRAKLVTAERAVEVIEPGHRVAIAPYTCTPYTLCEALYGRRDELEGLDVAHPVSLFPWFDSGEVPFQLRTFFATAADRSAVNADRVQYVPTGHWQAGKIPAGFVEDPDVYLLPISVPDRHGYASFGPGVWFSPTLCRQAKVVIAEVHEEFIRTGGENFVHISSIDYMTEAKPPGRRAPLPPRKEDEIPTAEVICALVASELVRDGDTLQIGVGTVSAALAPHLRYKHDLGIHTEIITGGVAELVAEGVVTGKHKALHRGKVVGTALAAMSKDERARIDGNPAFEMYEFNYVDDIRIIMRHDNVVAVNNALLVDLTGQVAAETLGTRVWTGAGGQTAFAIASQYSPGGRSVTVVPSTHSLNGQVVSRIVPALPEGTVVTVPRSFVDYVVTEHGIASLRGKTVRERVGELVAIAHPDFRKELRDAARRLYSVSLD